MIKGTRKFVVSIYIYIQFLIHLSMYFFIHICVYFFLNRLIWQFLLTCTSYLMTKSRFAIYLFILNFCFAHSFVGSKQRVCFLSYYYIFLILICKLLYLYKTVHRECFIKILDEPSPPPYKCTISSYFSVILSYFWFGNTFCLKSNIFRTSHSIHTMIYSYIV